MRARIAAQLFAPENRKWWTVAGRLVRAVHDHARQHGGERRAAVDPEVARRRSVRARVGRRLLRADVRDLHAHGRQARGLLRPAPALHHRAGDLHARVAGLRARAECQLPHRRTRRAGPRRGGHEPGDARDHHRDVPASSAWDGHRHLGRRLGDGSGHRPAARRADHRPHRLELDLLRQRSGGRARDDRRALGDRREPRHLARAAARLAGAGDLRGRALRTHLRADRGQHLRLDIASDPRDLCRRRDRTDRLRPPRAPPARANARPVAVP